jgi:hypothetical protein
MAISVIFRDGRGKGRFRRGDMSSTMIVALIMADVRRGGLRLAVCGVVEGPKRFSIPMSELLTPCMD